MKKKMEVLLAVLGILLLPLATEFSAQQGMKQASGGEWGMETQYGRMYDPKRVEIVVGNVSSIAKITPMQGMSQGIHLIVQTNEETISVHLGPAWYLEKQEIKLKPKDKVEIKGSRITLNDKPVILAAEVKKEDKTLKLRDENGVPVWSGGRSQ